MAECVSAVADVGMLVVTIILAMIASKALGQIEEMKTQNKNEAINQLYTRMFEIQKILFENKNLYEYIFESKPYIPISSSNINEQAFMELYADYLEHVVLQVDLLPYRAQTAWKTYVNKTLCRSNVIRKFILSDENIFDDKLVQIAKHKIDF